MPRIMVCVPTGVTEVEKRAVEEATREAGAREVCGSRRTNSSSNWCWYGYISTKWEYGNRYRWNYRYSCYIYFGGAVVSDSIKVGGDKFDAAIISLY